MSNKAEIVITAKNKTKGVFKSVRASMGRLSNSAAGTASKIAAMAGIAGLGLLVKSSLESADALAKNADRIGLTTEALAGLQHAATINGASAGIMTKSLELLNKNLGDVAKLGKGEAKSALDAIGLSAKELVKIPADEKFKLIAESIKGLSTQAEKAAIAQALMGKSGAKLLNTMELGADGIAEMEAEAEKLGITISRVDAAKIESANDSMERVKQAMVGIGNKVTVALSPILEEVANQFVGMATDGVNMEDTVKTVFRNVTKVAGIFADGLHGIKVIVKIMETAFRGLGMIAVDVFVGMNSGAGLLGNTLIELLQNVIVPVAQGLNKIGVISDESLKGVSAFMGARFETPVWITDMQTSVTAGFATAKDELHTLMMEQLPSEVFQAKIEQIIENAEVRAKATVAKIQANAGIDTGGEDSGTSEGLSPQEIKEQERLQAKLDRIAESLMTELEIINKKELAEIAVLQEAQDTKLINYDEFLSRKQKTEEKYEKQKEILRKKSIVNEKSSFDQLNAAAKIFGDKGAKISKLAALKTTIVNTHTGAMAAYQALAGIPIIGPALGAAAYATVWAQGIKSQQGIKSGSAGGGAVSGSAGGGGRAPTPPSSLGGTISAAPKETAETPEKIVNIHIHGDISSNDAERLIDDMQIILNETDRVLITPESRNGQEIAAAGGII